MIKINLSTSKRRDGMSFGGFDFTKIKVKAVLLAIVLIYIPDFVLVPMWESELEEKNQSLSTTETQLNSLKRKITQSQNFEKQIADLKAQEENLGQKLEAVKQAISEKKNPAPLLLYIAKNIPTDLWINELVLVNEEMTIKGEALYYTSIGNFVNNMRSSIFIKDASISSTNSTIRESDKRRIETFEVKFFIARFDQ